MSDTLDAEAAPGQRARWLRTVDFSRPTKFTTDQERRLTRAVEAYCRTATARLAAERVPCELELLDCSQHTWSNTQAHVPPGSVIALAGVEPLGTRVVLSAEHPLLLGALEALLGGSPERAPRDRKLTDIDLMLIRRVFDTLVEALSSVFSDHAGVQLTVTEVDPAGETTYLEQPSEPALALTMEARLGRASTVMVLLLPYHAVEPVLGRFTGRDEGSEGRDANSVDAIRAGVSRVDVTVRAEVADRIMPVHEILQLKPGDVVKLGSSADSHVTLCAEDVPVHRARPGRSGSRRAVQVLPPEHA
ncbi:MAG: FliM/FliN family flagellar motor switch protein [Actinomycetota bacterium]|nr:FliM/FliN family flagellar motor switch protein [Actinomycetota bacterium]